MKKSYFNDFNFLCEDKETMDFHNIVKNKYKKSIEESIEENKNIIYDYDRYIELIADELMKFKFNSSLDYSVALGYLIDKGYLSDKLNYKTEVAKNEILAKLGISILLGSGCCRNVSDMHKDVFNKLDINSNPFYCYQGVNFFNKGENKEANHVINLVNYEDNLYGIDLNNSCLLYHFVNPFIMSSISSVHSEKLRYKPYYDYVFDDKTINEIEDKIVLYKDCSKKKKISFFEYEMEIKDRVENVLFENRSELIDFHNKTKTLRKKIINNIKE